MISRSATILLILSLVFAGGGVWAQENEQAMKINFSYGRVVRILDDQIVVNEYDEMGEKEIEVIYVINDQTALENANSITDLIEGDYIDIDYRIIDGQNIALLIVGDTYDEEEFEFWGNE